MFGAYIITSIMWFTLGIVVGAGFVILMKMK